MERASGGAVCGGGAESGGGGLAHPFSWEAVIGSVLGRENFRRNVTLRKSLYFEWIVDRVRSQASIFVSLLPRYA